MFDFGKKADIEATSNLFDFGKKADIEATSNLFDFGKGLTLRLYVIYVSFWEGG